jgi:hypothetical protein
MLRKSAVILNEVKDPVTARAGGLGRMSATEERDASLHSA